MATTADVIRWLEKDSPVQYQRALIFSVGFQKSEDCKSFRKAWAIPAEGFLGYPDWHVWEAKLIERTNTYYRSDKYKAGQAQITRKRLEVARGKITETDLKIFAMRKSWAIPLHKYDYDIDQITVASGLPIYWRDFIEQCLLFSTIERMYVQPIRKPLPTPRLKWNFYGQCHEMVIEDVFPDTNVRDFTSKKFTRQLQELQKKLPGYSAKKPRRKKTLEFGLEIQKLDQQSKLTDMEKADAIMGEIGGLDFGSLDRKRSNRVRQARYRTRKLMGGGRRNAKRNG
jgi:hypothetical protein